MIKDSLDGQSIHHNKFNIITGNNAHDNVQSENVNQNETTVVEKLVDTNSKLVDTNSKLTEQIDRLTRLLEKVTQV